MALKWDRQGIQKQWQPIDFDYPAALSPIEMEYCRYYGIDLEHQFRHFLHGFGYCEIEGFRLATHYYRPRMGKSKGTLVLLHGYFDHVGIFRHLIRFCLEREYSVLIYDLPGHGLSTGEPAGIEGFQQYVEILGHYLATVRANFDEPWYLLGQSTGGAIAMAYLMANRLGPINTPFANVFLLAPLVRPVKWRKMLWLYRASKHLFRTVRRKYMLCSHDEQFLDFIKNRDPLQYARVPLSWVSSLIDWSENFAASGRSGLSPVVIQGGEDTTIDWRYNLAVIDEKFNRPIVHFLPQARHHLVNEAVEIRNQVFAVLGAYLD